MVSDTTTQIERGPVEWKPEPKERQGGKDGSWTSYQIKVNDTYFDCSQKIYNAVREDEAIEFTYTTRHYEKRDGSEGVGYKIADLIGPATLDDTDTPSGAMQFAEAARGAREPTVTRVGMIGSLPGAEIGAMENRAWQEAMRVAGMADQQGIRDDDYTALLMQQARMGSWFKAQQIPSADEPEVVPLQDEPGYVNEIARIASMTEEESEQRSKHGLDEPDWADGPDPSGDEREA